MVVAGLAIAREIIRNNYYVGEQTAPVAIFQGVQTSFLGLSLQEPFLVGCLNARNELSLITFGQSSDSMDCEVLRLEDIRESERAQVAAGLPAGSLDDAIRQINELSRTSLLPICALPTKTATPTPSPRATPAPTVSPAPAPSRAPRRRRPPRDSPAARHSRRAEAGHPRAGHPATAQAADPVTDRHGPAPTTAGAGHQLPDRVMTSSTQPQSPVTVTPPLPNRRNAELVLLVFAAVITTVALVLVEANQEQGLGLGSGPVRAGLTWPCSAPPTWRCGASRRTPTR